MCVWFDSECMYVCLSGHINGASCGRLREVQSATSEEDTVRRVRACNAELVSTSVTPWCPEEATVAHVRGCDAELLWIILLTQGAAVVAPLVDQWHRVYASSDVAVDGDTFPSAEDSLVRLRAGLADKIAQSADEVKECFALCAATDAALKKALADIDKKEKALARIAEAHRHQAALSSSSAPNYPDPKGANRRRSARVSEQVARPVCTPQRAASVAASLPDASQDDNDSQSTNSAYIQSDAALDDDDVEGKCGCVSRLEITGWCMHDNLCIRR